MKNFLSTFSFLIVALAALPVFAGASDSRVTKPSPSPKPPTFSCIVTVSLNGEQQTNSTTEIQPTGRGDAIQKANAQCEKTMKVAIKAVKSGEACSPGGTISGTWATVPSISPGISTGNGTGSDSCPKAAKPKGKNQ